MIDNKVWFMTAPVMAEKTLGKGAGWGYALGVIAITAINILGILAQEHYKKGAEE